MQRQQLHQALRDHQMDISQISTDILRAVTCHILALGKRLNRFYRRLQQLLPCADIISDLQIKRIQIIKMDFVGHRFSPQ